MLHKKNIFMVAIFMYLCSFISNPCHIQKVISGFPKLKPDSYIQV